MGTWAKSLFGKENFSSVGIVVAGTNSKEFEKKILNYFDEVISSKDSVYHAHLVKKGKKEYPIMFNVYGASAMVDVLSEMHDGGCRNIIFIGYAYGGFKNLDVGTVVLPLKSYHYDGIFHAMNLDNEFSSPNIEMFNVLKGLLHDYVEGINISVPAVTLQLPHTEYKNINPISVEMETAACFSRSKQIGIRSAAILIISDNKSESIGSDDKIKERRKSKEKVIKLIIDNLDKFDLPDLGIGFKVDDYLANVIDDPEDETNIYKK